MRQSPLWLAAIIGGAFVLFGCAGPTPKESSDRATLASESSAALDAFKNEDPTLSDVMRQCVGYAVFPEVGKAGFIAGASYGKGEVYEAGKKIGYADITQATVGLQAGAQSFGELILFLRSEDLQKFKLNQFTFAGNVSAVAIKSGAAASADQSHGVLVFVRTKGGLMAEASVGGQRFRFQPLNVVTSQPSGAAAAAQ